MIKRQYSGRNNEMEGFKIFNVQPTDKPMKKDIKQSKQLLKEEETNKLWRDLM